MSTPEKPKSETDLKTPGVSPSGHTAPNPGEVPGRVQLTPQGKATAAGARCVIPLAILLAIPTYLWTRHLFEPFSSWFDHVVLLLLSAEVCAAGVAIAGALVWAGLGIFDRFWPRTLERPQGSTVAAGRCCAESGLGDTRDSSLNHPLFCAACGRVAPVRAGALILGTIAGPVASACICAISLPTGGVGNWVRRSMPLEILPAGHVDGSLLNQFATAVLILIGFVFPSRLLGGLWVARNVRLRGVRRGKGKPQEPSSTSGPRDDAPRLPS